MPAAASIIHSTSCLLSYFRLTTVVHIILLATPEGEIYWLRSGDRTGHSAVVPFLTTFPDISSLHCAVSCQNVEASSYVVCTSPSYFKRRVLQISAGLFSRNSSSSTSGYERLLSKGDTSRNLPSVM